MAKDESSVSIDIPVIDDMLSEGDETFRVEFLPSSTVGQGDPSALTVTIPANDPIRYSISPPPGDVMEGSDAEFEVTLGAETTRALMLEYTVAVAGDGTPQGTTPDYTDPNSGSILIAAGSTRTTITITINGDALAEGQETLTVTLTGDANGIGTVVQARATATATIPENEANVREFFVVDGDFTALAEDAAAARSYNVSFRPVGGISANADLPSTTTVRWSLVGSSASGANPIEAADFAETSGTLTFAAGTSSVKNFSVTVTNDNLNEGAESYRVSLRVVSGDTAGSAGVDSPVGTVADDAADTITVAFTAGPVTTINEGEHSTQTLVRSGGTPTAENVVVPLLITPVAMQDEVRITNPVGLRILRVPDDVTVTGGETGLYGFAVFTATGGQYATNATFQIMAFNDNLLEDAEMVSVTIGDPTAAAYSSVPGVGSAGTVARATPAPTYTGTIAANDPITVAVNPVRGQERGVGEGSNLGYTITFSNNRPTADITVGMTIEGIIVGSTTGTENADFDAAASGWNTSAATVTTDATITVADVVLGRPIALPTLRVVTGDTDDREETFQLTVVPSGGAPAQTAAIARFSPPQVTTTSTILRIDTEAPGLNGVGYATDDPTRRAWLRSGDPELAILLPSEAAAPAGSGAQTGAMLGGFSVMVMSRPTDTRTVSVQAMYSSPNVIVLTLPPGAALTADDMGVFARYEYPGSGLGIFDRSLEAGLRPADDQNRNQQRGPLMISLAAFSETADTDGDGIPDATEAKLNGDPLDSELPAGVPQVSVDEDMLYFAYSGIRRHGIDTATLISHLGLTTTGTASFPAVSAEAYYLDRGNCTGGQFPANYDAPMGGCERVNFWNMKAGENHKIGWVVMGDDVPEGHPARGYWFTANTPSRLPEQTVYRVPELNMLSQHLFFASGATDSDAVSIKFERDGRETDQLTFESSEGNTEELTGARFSREVNKSDLGGASRTYSIADLVDATLYEPSTAGHRPGENDYSLGLVTQTQVVVVPDSYLWPRFGALKLTRMGSTSTSVVNFVVRGDSYKLTVEMENMDDAVRTIPHTGFTNVEGHRGFDRDDISTDVGTLTVDFTVPTDAPELLSLMLTAYAPHGGATRSAVYSWRVINTNDRNVVRLGMPDDDDDGDGIPNTHDRYEDMALPVLVKDTAGEDGSHHMRLAVPLQQQLRVGGHTLRRLEERSTQTVTYALHSASANKGEKVRYNFEIHGVDYDVGEDGNTTGGMATVFVKLPESSFSRGLQLAKFADEDISAHRHLFSVYKAEGHGEYGFESSRLGEDCPVPNGNNYKATERGEHDCLMVRIRDGGRHDEDCWSDGSYDMECRPNGIIRDPLGFGRDAPGGGSGGSVGLLGIALLMLALAATLLRRRRVH